VFRILVINFTRMGDIIQTSPLIRGLKEKYPSALISLLVIKSFSSIARLIPEVDHVLEWDQEESVEGLLLDKKNLEQVFLDHRNFVDSVRNKHWNLVINVTHSKSSAVLCSMLSADQIHGIHQDSYGNRKLGHNWSKYFFTVTANRDVNDFNLVDIYRQTGDLSASEGSQLSINTNKSGADWAEECLRNFSKKKGMPEATRFVMLQLSASKTNRRWPIENFVKSANRIYQEFASIFVIAGTKSEHNLAEKFMSLTPDLPVLNLCGKTNLEQLAAVCGRMDLLISNDTGTMHVAASQGVNCLCLFFATALPAETAPYCEGAIILQANIECAPCSHHVICPHVMCRDLIRADDVFHAAAQMLNGELCNTKKTIESELEWPEGHQIRAWRSFRDSHGFLDLEPLIKHELHYHQFVSRCYRRLWQYSLSKTLSELCMKELCLGFEDELLQWLSGVIIPADLSGLLRELENSGNTLKKLSVLAEKGVRQTKIVEEQLSSAHPNIGLIEAVAREVSQIDAGIYKTELSRLFLRPLGVLFRFDKEGLEDQLDFSLMNFDMRAIYQELLSRLNGLESLIRIASQTLSDYATDKIHAD
jgi:ADP-heptose:LPS heptosyltransferase